MAAASNIDSDKVVAILVAASAEVDRFAAAATQLEPVPEPAQAPESGEGQSSPRTPQPAPAQHGGDGVCDSDDLGDGRVRRYMGEDRDTEIVEGLKKQFGEDFDKLDLSAFTGCYVNSLLISTYPERVREPHPPPAFRAPRPMPTFHFIKTPPVDQARQPLYEKMVACTNAAGAFYEGGAGPSTARAANAGTSAGAGASSGGPSGARRAASAAGSSRTPRAAKKHKGAPKHKGAQNSGAGAGAGPVGVKRTASASSHTPRPAKKQKKAVPDSDADERVVLPSSSAGGAAKDDGADHAAPALPEPDVVKTRKGGYKVRNEDVFFKPHPIKKGYQCCRKCGEMVWPPNRQKHIVKCLGLVAEPEED